LEALAVDEIDKEQYPLTGPLVASTLLFRVKERKPPLHVH
jgi:hypothetical protein